MGFFDALDASASALTAQRLRMDTISGNLANSNTTRTAKGEAFRREMVVFESSPGRHATGVRVSKIVDDPSPFRMAYEPGHPDANKDGYVAYPNVNPVTEMVDLISASRSYEANTAVIGAFKGIAQKATEI
ncbi:MAG TPA: flagellar basal body rod protein FlgC [Cyanobacteria bacterium UBA8530]|nr:flagellar basal body rod protein FlgC [Cyanobacteria bacterium UBA8530]